MLILYGVLDSDFFFFLTRQSPLHEGIITRESKCRPPASSNKQTCSGGAEEKASHRWNRPTTDWFAGTFLVKKCSVPIDRVHQGHWKCVRLLFAVLRYESVCARALEWEKWNIGSEQKSLLKSRRFIKNISAGRRDDKLAYSVLACLDQRWIISSKRHLFSVWLDAVQIMFDLLLQLAESPPVLRSNHS